MVGMLLWPVPIFSHDTHLLPTALTTGPMRFRVQASRLDRVYFKVGLGVVL